MSATPRVSIGLPVYNGYPYLPEAILSILTQTFEDFELVITDNASTDCTARTCQSFSDRQIRYFPPAAQPRCRAQLQCRVLHGAPRGHVFPLARP